jgi:hypothetical protein
MYKGENMKELTIKFSEERVVGGMNVIYTEYDSIKNDKPVSKTVFLLTEEEKQRQEKQIRIDKLRQLISDKKLLDEPCTDEQDELKQLLGL